MYNRLNQEALLGLMADCNENDGRFQINIHNYASLDAAVETAEKLTGHGEPTIAVQPSCYVVTARRGTGEVAFYIGKEAPKTRKPVKDVPEYVPYEATEDDGDDHPF